MKKNLLYCNQIKDDVEKCNKTYSPKIKYNDNCDKLLCLQVQKVVEIEMVWIPKLKHEYSIVLLSTVDNVFSFHSTNKRQI